MLPARLESRPPESVEPDIRTEVDAGHVVDTSWIQLSEILIIKLAVWQVVLNTDVLRIAMLDILNYCRICRPAQPPLLITYIRIFYVCVCDSVWHRLEHPHAAMTVIEGITGPNLSKSVCSSDLSLQVAWCHYWGRSDSCRSRAGSYSHGTSKDQSRLLFDSRIWINLELEGVTNWNVRETWVIMGPLV